MRPRTLDEFVGQEHFLGPGKLLRRLLQADRLSSVIFYGPPGTGKTALAHVIAHHTQCHFRQLNAVAAGIKEVRALLQEATAELEAIGPLLTDIVRGTQLPEAAPERDAFEPILNMISRHSSIDFRQYKPTTILRRIGRRMAIRHLPSIEEYRDYLEAHAIELG